MSLGFPVSSFPVMPPPGFLVSAENGGHFPVPMASHEDVVNDRTLFINTLKRFHHTIGSKNLVPIIGGRELNLHALYSEVTRRGGFHKVVTDRKWREISSLFDLPGTATSASYALRKHYSAILYHYELVYFFPRTGNPSFRATGTIEGKFDSGYLVTVKLGNETLNGVLYHPHHQQVRQPKPRTRRKRASDGRPKPSRSGYNFFFAERHAELKSLYPTRISDFTKMIGHSWNNLSPEEKEVYQSIGLKDKERYKDEMKEYKEKMEMENTVDSV